MVSKINKSRKIIVTNALPYANGEIHLGHILEHIQTDIWVRFMRSAQHEVLSFCADDAHGAPIMMKAEELGLEPANFIDQVKNGHVEALARFGISYTNYHSTHSDENKELVSEIYLDAKIQEIYLKKKLSSAMTLKKKCFWLIDMFQANAQNVDLKINMVMAVIHVGRHIPLPNLKIQNLL